MAWASRYGGSHLHLRTSFWGGKARKDAVSSDMSNYLSLFPLSPCSSQFRPSLFLYRPNHNHQHLFTPTTLDHRLQAVPKTQTSSVDPASLVQSATCVRNHQKRSSAVEPLFHPSGSRVALSRASPTIHFPVHWLRSGLKPLPAFVLGCEYILLAIIGPDL